MSALVRGLLGIFVILASFSAYADLELAKKRCAPTSEDEPILYATDFQWGYSLPEMQKRYEEIYESGKRLKSRAHYDPSTDTFVFHQESIFKKSVIEEIEIPAHFLQSITNHINEGLKREYVNFIFFPDMGHSHYFIPQGYYDEVIKQIPPTNRKQKYEALMGHKGLKILYHTAEQLSMKDRESKHLHDDDFLRWRYYTRNLVGFNNGSDKVEIHKDLNRGFNTVRDHDGGQYRYWGAGFNISASKDGCFPFTTKSGETHYFDISLEDLPRNSEGNGF